LLKTSRTGFESQPNTSDRHHATGAAHRVRPGNASDLPRCGMKPRESERSLFAQFTKSLRLMKFKIRSRSIFPLSAAAKPNSMNPSCDSPCESVPSEMRHPALRVNFIRSKLKSCRSVFREVHAGHFTYSCHLPRTAHFLVTNTPIQTHSMTEVASHPIALRR